jgi:3-methyladenine DNA glycosylase/8-oxoguanine DNA glycosylase
MSKSAKGITQVCMEIDLCGPGGEPVDLSRTFASHGLANLPPFSVERNKPLLTVTLSLGRTARTVLVSSGKKGRATVSVKGTLPSPQLRSRILHEIRHVLRLDEDLSRFYELIGQDPSLSFAAGGAGRLIRSQTVFEEVVKTICTTNCAWSATERMIGALVEHLGKPAPDAPQSGVAGRAFPSPEAMAEEREEFYRGVVRAGYRGAYLRSLARSVAAGEVNLEELERHSSAALSDDEVEKRLLSLPGVGPYAAAHVMMMLGRYSRLILDSWTRPKYASLAGRKTVSDRNIERRFRSYGQYAGLAFWLFVTKDWIEEANRIT